jgi:hypothetical protein
VVYIRSWRSRTLKPLERSSHKSASRLYEKAGGPAEKVFGMVSYPKGNNSRPIFAATQVNPKALPPVPCNVRRPLGATDTYTQQLTSVYPGAAELPIKNEDILCIPPKSEWGDISFLHIKPDMSCLSRDSSAHHNYTYELVMIEVVASDYKANALPRGQNILVPNLSVTRCVSKELVVFVNKPDKLVAGSSIK